LFPAGLLPFCAGVPAIGVGQLAKHDTVAKSGPWFRIASLMPPSIDLTPLSASDAVGLGHEPQPLPDVRSPDARSRDTDRPEGVAFSFQVRLNKVEPAVVNRRFNLLTKDDARLALLDEVEPCGP
jgi:hypothetical protein